MGPKTACINSAVAAIITCAMALPAGAQSRVDDLLRDLQTAPPENAPWLEGKIIEEWSQSGSPAMDLLLSRGRAALAQGDAETAIGHLTALTDMAPDFAEGFVARAEAYLTDDKPGPALADLRRALFLEPRQFEALQGLAAILMETGQTERARAVLDHLRTISPHNEAAGQILQMLDADSGAQDA